MTKSLKTLLAVTALLASVFSASTFANAPKTETPEPAKMNVITFAGGWNLPVWVAQRQGFFKQNGLDVKLDYTPNSKYFAKNLANGTYQMAIAGVDNVIAYNEGQGALPLENPNMVAVFGMDNGLLSFAAKADIKSATELKGKTLAVDALDTGYAFVLYDYLDKHGLKQVDANIQSIGSTGERYVELTKGTIDGTLVRTPLNVQAKNAGLNILATGKALGDYQGTVGVVTRGWSDTHEAEIVNFIKAYKQGLDWLYQPENRKVAEALLVANDANMTPELAPLALDELLTNGLTRDGSINEQGIKNVMELRSKYAEQKKPLTDAKKYYDVKYYQQAVK